MPCNGTARFKKCNRLFGYQHLLLLRDIVHCSVLGQTSPKVLPLSQIEIVHREVQKISSADLDTDFSKMQSVVVSDPNDPKLLLVIVNAAAISKSTTDLITKERKKEKECFDLLHVPFLTH